MNLKRIALVGLLVFWWQTVVGAPLSQAEPEEGEMVTVQRGLLELQTGPGRGYPVIYTAEPGQTLRLIKARGIWVKLQVKPAMGVTQQWVTGWVPKVALRAALQPHGNDATVPETSELAGVSDWAVGIAAGQLDSTPAMQIYGHYDLTQTFSLKADVYQVLGEFSELRMASLGVTHYFANLSLLQQIRLRPWVSISGGMVQVLPKTTLAKEKKRTEELVRYGVGLRYKLDARYSMGVGYEEWLVFTERDNNEHPVGWMANLEVRF